MMHAVPAMATLTRYDEQGGASDEWVCLFEPSGQVWMREKGEMPRDEMLGYFWQLQHAAPRMRRADAPPSFGPGAPSWIVWYDPPLMAEGRGVQLLERILVPGGKTIAAFFDFPDEVGQLFCDDWEMISGLLDVLIDRRDCSQAVYVETGVM
jgi:hypothetical protein